MATDNDAKPETSRFGHDSQNKGARPKALHGLMLAGMWSKAIPLQDRDSSATSKASSECNVGEQPGSNPQEQVDLGHPATGSVCPIAIL